MRETLYTITAVGILIMAAVTIGDYQADENMNMLGNNVTNASYLFGNISATYVIDNPAACPSYSGINQENDDGTNTCLDAWIHRDGDLGMTGAFKFDNADINITENSNLSVTSINIDGWTISTNGTCMQFTAPNSTIPLSLCP